jgi:hypothetical protein
MFLFSAGVLSLVLAYLSLGPTTVVGDEFNMDEMDERGCPIYTQYSQVPHGDRSSGPLGLPFMRPEERCRTFNSSAVEVSFVSHSTFLVSSFMRHCSCIQCQCQGVTIAD